MGDGMRSFVLSCAREPEYPGVWHEIKVVTGEEGAANLVAHYGGTRLYIPHTSKTDHLLCQLIGQEAAQKLSYEFAGMSVDIPRAAQMLIAQRNGLIAADRATGMSQRQLALKYGLTERTIRKIKS